MSCAKLESTVQSVSGQLTVVCVSVPGRPSQPTETDRHITSDVTSLVTSHRSLDTAADVITLHVLSGEHMTFQSHDCCKSDNADTLVVVNDIYLVCLCISQSILLLMPNLTVGCK